MGLVNSYNYYINLDTLKSAHNKKSIFGYFFLSKKYQSPEIKSNIIQMSHVSSILVNIDNRN